MNDQMEPIAQTSFYIQQVLPQSERLKVFQYALWGLHLNRSAVDRCWVTLIEKYAYESR
jgi:hypothetical protein